MPLLAVAGFAAFLVGCEEGEEITRYTVPKQHVLEAINPGETGARGPKAAARMPRPQGPAAERTVAAIVPRGSQTWFFKMTGPNAAVLKETEPFLTAFIKSLRFPEGEDSKPEWTVPDGWREEGGSGLRFATLRAGSAEQPVEITVIPLASGDGDRDEYVLSNVNRWREQLGGPPIKQSELAQYTHSVELEGGIPATIVDLAGNAASQATEPGRADPAAGAARPGSEAPSRLTYDTPEGWTEAANDAFSQAALEVADGSQKLRITVSALAAAAGDVLQNVNRWRQQIQLPPISQEELERAIKPIEIDGAPGRYVQLVGPKDAPRRESIYGVVLVKEDRVWFFKLKGDAPLAEREAKRFEEFVKSVKFKEPS